MRRLRPEDYQDIVRRALAEDIGSGDVTTDATVPAGQRARGVFLVKQACVLAGLDVAADTFRQLQPDVEVYVSAGALTHSAPAVDISFEIEPIPAAGAGPSA